MTIVQQHQPVSRTGHLVKADPAKIGEILWDHAKRTAEGYDSPNAISVAAQSDVGTDLESALRFLDPLVQGPFPTRQLILETQRKGWTRIFSNNLEFAGLPSRGAFLTKQLKTESIFFLLQPHLAHGTKSTSASESGAIQFVYYVSGEKRRVIELVYDGTWKFSESGQPFPFEHTERYKARNKVERFTPEMLIDLLANFKLYPFNDDFYRVNSRHVARGVALDVHSGPLLKDDFKPVSLEKLLKQWLPTGKK